MLLDFLVPFLLGVLATMAVYMTYRSTLARDPVRALVENFAADLLAKLLRARRKFNGKEDWVQDDWQDRLACELVNHINKGDPLDVAAYAAFANYHGWQTYPPEAVELWLVERQAVVRSVVTSDGIPEWVVLMHGQPSIRGTTLLDAVYKALRQSTEDNRVVNGVVRELTGQGTGDTTLGQVWSQRRVTPCQATPA